MRDSGDLPSALEKTEEIVGLAGVRHPALFLDYDGTLTPIVERPELALLPESMRLILADAAALFPVAVISGRDLENVKALVGLVGLVYAGSHGFDMEVPGKGRRRPPLAEAHLPLLERAAAGLTAGLAGIAGAQIERKAFTIAVHYRRVEESRVGDVERAVDTVLSATAGLRKKGGKKVFELQPAMDWDKGKSALWLLDELGWGGDDPFPVYIGDDLTDEDAFRAVEGRGLGIIVRDEDRPTAARYALDSVEETALFLSRLIAFAGKRPSQDD